MNKHEVMGVEVGITATWSRLARQFKIEAGTEGSTEYACWRMDRNLFIANSNLYAVYVNECDRNPRPHI